MYLRNSKTVVIKIGSSLLIDDKSVITKKYSYHRQDKKSYKNYFNLVNKQLKTKTLINDGFYINLNKFIKNLNR